jgi:hypothetical protein
MVVGTSVIKKWDGTSWSDFQPNAFLTSVSCASVDMCLAVGQPTMLWDGATWSTVPSAPSWITGVACTSRQACVGVGGLAGSDGRTHPVVYSWDGANWAQVPTPEPSTSYSSLRSVACSGPDSCTAVGVASTGQVQPLIESWDGAAWTISPVANATDGGSLLDVSCADASSCTTVGWSNSGSLIASGGDEGWGVVPSPQTGNGPDFLVGVGCSAATFCAAVGRHETLQGEWLPLTVRYG